MYVGAASTVIPFSSSAISAPPFTHFWWSTQGRQHQLLCDALLLDSVTTPYVLELFVGTSRGFKLPHFKFVDHIDAKHFRFRLEYNTFNYTYQTNSKHVQHSMIEQHDGFFGLPTHTRSMTRLTHHEHSDCIGVLFFVALSEFFASSFFNVSMTSASVGARALRV